MFKNTQKLKETDQNKDQENTHTEMLLNKNNPQVKKDTIKGIIKYLEWDEL